MRRRKTSTGSLEQHAPEWNDQARARLIDRLRTSRIVLLGEASHGTHEFYAERARITQDLIADLEFDAVAAEADWPDAYRLGCYIKGLDDDDVDEALGVFDRFPRWMWANEVVAGFARWLRRHNRAGDAESATGFYGLDLYSLRRSMQSVVRYLEDVDTDAAVRARHRYDCFDRWGDDPADYAYAGLGSETCEEAVVEQLVDLQKTVEKELRRAAPDDPDDAFFARQNAVVVKNAEQYYRSMFRGGAHTWNLRDTHMFETLVALDQHLTKARGRPARIAVWAHNSHLGDARATSMSRRGELNLGQLVRQRYGAEATNIGFTSFTGTVRAADDWGGRDRIKDVRPALDGSYEALFHEIGGDLLMGLRDGGVAGALDGPLLERAIGVIYRPETERISHYFEARLPDQFDWVIHLDETRAIDPIEGPTDDSPEDVPETYPSGV